MGCLSFFSLPSVKSLEIFNHLRASLAKETSKVTVRRQVGTYRQVITLRVGFKLTPSLEFLSNPFPTKNSIVTSFKI